jgi:hypothetical protein
MRRARRVSYAQDLWTLKYLGRDFKWHHLSQEIAYQKRVREKKLRTRIAHAKREAEFFLNNVDKAHLLEHIHQRKNNNNTNKNSNNNNNSGIDSGDGDDDGGSQHQHQNDIIEMEEDNNNLTTPTNTTIHSHPIKRTFKQKLPTNKPIEDDELDDEFLKSVYMIIYYLSFFSFKEREERVKEMRRMRAKEKERKGERN